jgi:23S rRNA (cytosine1962-C5)-methyltransferase
LIRLTLKPGREASVIRRHPWLFSGAVARTEGDGADGHAEILDPSGRPLARGAYSPDSQIVARLWTFDGALPDASLFRDRFRSARALREQILPPETSGYRAVHSEGDRCPGVLLDVYGEAAVLELTTAGTEAWRAELEAAARDVFAPGRLLVRETGAAHDSRSRSNPPVILSEAKDPELSRDSSALARLRMTAGLAPFLENGLRFLADLGSGQKTGFFLDQRDNRARLKSLARSRSVLNLFSYSGAFSVAALAGGASKAVDVDSSAAALALAREHRRLNGLPAPEDDFVAADVFDDLRRRVAAREQYDLVVCDPPAFAKKRSDLDGAARGYKDVNRLAMSLVGPGGWILTCSCSGLVDADLFQKIVFGASVDARASFALVARQGAGADHPVSLDCPEGEYLKGLWLRRLQ